MKIAIMQPYTFPYMGYFHLIHASNQFVFYDDVNFIKRGWVHRNRILLNHKDFLFTIPLSNASQNRLINETRLAIDNRWVEKFQKTLTQSYQKAPYFPRALDLIMSVLSTPYENVADLAINSIVSVYEYLGMQIKYTKSSVSAPETKGSDRSERLIEISKKLGHTIYINPVGGKSLYDKEYFRQQGIELKYIKSDIIKYKQYNNEFIPWLSIIDVLMFNDIRTIQEFFEMYAIE